MHMLAIRQCKQLIKTDQGVGKPETTDNDQTISATVSNLSLLQPKTRLGHLNADPHDDGIVVLCTTT